MEGILSLLFPPHSLTLSLEHRGRGSQGSHCKVWQESMVRVLPRTRILSHSVL